MASKKDEFLDHLEQIVDKLNGLRRLARQVQGEATQYPALQIRATELSDSIADMQERLDKFGQWLDVNWAPEWSEKGGGLDA